MKTKKVAVVGASGYSGEELVGLLLHHPHAELVAVTSRQNAGQTLAQVFPKFSSHPKSKILRFTEPKAAALAKQAEIIFLALPHGIAAEYAAPLLKAGCTVIDLSADFRLKSAEIYKEFYAHDHPGCYPTSILLPLIPLLKSTLIKPTGIIANSLSGVSGAGRKIEGEYLFVECNESIRPYGLPKHRHLSEIEEQLSIAAKTQVTIQFTPHLIPVNRGILTTLYLEPAGKLTEEKISACYKKFYGDEPFVRLLEGKSLPDTKNVQGTNVIEIAWRLDARTGRLIVMSTEDNLVKGASGQAVQSLNILCGWPETAGLI
jgi:N-acetyl-gamma-glutamyl-phosphate reductase